MINWQSRQDRSQSKGLQRRYVWSGKIILPTVSGSLTDPAPPPPPSSPHPELPPMKKEEKMEWGEKQVDPWLAQARYGRSPCRKAGHWRHALPAAYLY